MKWLHLSDIHFHCDKFSTEQLREQLINKIKELNLKLDFIIITGDFFYKNNSGKNTIPDTVKFIKELAKSSGVAPQNVFLCQGNHDLDRNNSKRNKTIEDILSKKEYELEKSDYDELIEVGNDSFRSLFRTIKAQEYKDYAVFERKNIKVRIISINSCLLSKDDSDFHNLRVCVPELAKLSKKIKDDDKLNIVIMHHCTHWLHPDDARKFEHWAEDNFIDALFVGHTHQPNVMPLNDVNREINQFTSGALVIDGYAVPTFFLCEESSGDLNVQLYSYSTSTDDWEIGNQNLRTFSNNGMKTFSLSRRKSNKIPFLGQNETINLDDYTCEEFIDKLNDAYRKRFNSRKLFSEKTGENEDFDAWKMISSLGSLGIPYPVAIKLAIQVVKYVVTQELDEESIPRSSFLRDAIEKCITNCHAIYPEISEYDIGIWQNKYSRHYNKNVGFSTIDDRSTDQISYSLLKSSILKEVIDKITGDEIYYDKIATNDRETMAAEIMEVIKRLGISQIKRSVLLDLITEYVTEPPHPWFVNNNRDKLFQMHKDNADKYLSSLSTIDADNPSLQISAAFHLFSAYLTLYDNYLGCTQIGPIKILRNAVRQYGTNHPKPPMRRCMIIQLREDLKGKNISFEEFQKNVSIVYKNIVEKKDVTLSETVNALIWLRGTLTSIEDKKKEVWEPSDNTFDDIYSVFCNATGFIVREPIRYFDGKAFCFAPYWDELQKNTYHLGDDVLVCLLSENTTIDKIADYLSQQRKERIKEVVFFKPDALSFSPEERKQIREQLKQKEVFIRCIFIQEQDLSRINTAGWRKELFKVISVSKYSC